MVLAWSETATDSPPLPAPWTPGPAVVGTEKSDMLTECSILTWKYVAIIVETYMKKDQTISTVEF